MSYKDKLKGKIDECLKNLNENDFDAIDKDKLMQLRNELNPYNKTIRGQRRWVNFSVVTAQRDYERNYLTTSMIGFLNRMVSEWKVPEGLTVVTPYEYLENPSLLDPPKAVIEKGDPTILRNYEFNKNWMQARLIVQAFLEEMFVFNPNEHVRSAYKPNYADTSRTPVETMAGKLAVDILKNTDPLFKEKHRIHTLAQKMKGKNGKKEEKSKEKKESLDNLDENIKSLHKKIESQKVLYGRNGEKRILNIPQQLKSKSLEQTTTSEPITQDALDPLETKFNQTHEIVVDNNNVPTNHIGLDTSAEFNVRAMIPPADVFERFTRYREENHDVLAKATQDLYCTKPDTQWSINVYSVHDVEEEAFEYQKKHKDDVITDIHMAQTNQWTIFDSSFKEIRDKTNYFTEKTAVIEEMLQQAKRDSTLASDMLKKRVDKSRSVNEIEHGKHDEAFKKWRSENQELKGITASEDSNRIEIPVWKVNPTTREIAVDIAYVKAEGSEAVNNPKKKVMSSSLSASPLS